MKNIFLPIVAAISLFVIMPPVSQAATDNKVPLKVGFITVGPKTDWGYNYAHEQGRIYMQSHMPKQIETEIVENVPESAEAERVMEKMIARGARLIFSTSYGHYEPALRVAARHPDVVFEQCGRVEKDTKNLATYFAKQYQPMYVSGMVSGKMTKTNNIGFIAAHPVPQVLQNVNAFTLGARSVNDKVKVHVVWTNSWSDPPKEAEAAKGLIDTGCDILTMHLDSPITVVQTAEKNGIYSVGYHTDLNKFAPKGWLTGEAWDWGPLYVKIANTVINHSFKPGNYRYAMNDGYTKLSSFGKVVPKSVQQEALALEKKIEKGEYVVFQGPLKDRNGKQLLAAGQKPTLDFIESMNWVVPGVEGSLTAK
jgi:basic membrane lipoprotein Med (substrate-binding protein (PBP1-ABC) superfamily)